MEKSVETIAYHHINIEFPAQTADGAYCLSGRSGDVHINFFQEIPGIPETITFCDDPNAPEQKKTENMMESSSIPYWEIGGDCIKRVFISKIRLNEESARQLISNVQATLDDMRK